MRRRTLNRLSVKVFLISFIVQVISGLLICAVLYSQPQMMYSPVDELDDLIEELQDVSREEGEELIDDFISRTGMDLAFFDADTYISHRRNVPLTDIGTLTLKDIDSYNEAFESSLDGRGMGTFGVQFSDDPTEYLVQYFDYGEKINLIPRAMHKSYPLMITVVVSLSLISSLIYTFLFASPVKKLSRVSRSMAQMDFTVRCNDRRGDEIGDLARDLNTMSETLDQKIRELQTEIDRVRELEMQKEMFFAAASHELKTPVTILEGHIRGMLEGVGAYEDHDEYLTRSLRTVKRMESLINEILTASKMQSADDVVMTSVDMSEVLEDKIKEAGDLLVIRDLTVDKDIDSDLYFSGNKELTAMAVGAFISNAVFYSKEGSGIKVSAHKDNGKIKVLIENSDAHIDEEDLEHLFEPFYRSDKSRNSRDGGSGLGLYIARLIIDKQGGNCSLGNTDRGVTAAIFFNSI